MTPESPLKATVSAWHRMTAMLSQRHVGLIGLAWCFLFLFSVFGAASGALQPVAVGMASSLSSTFLPRDEAGRTNILLLGVGDKDHPGASLTDSIIIASIEPWTHSIVFLSLPRDLYLTDSPTVPDARINAFYANARNRFMRQGMTESGASLLAMQTMADEIGSRLGTSIHGVIKVDFTAFSDIVDSFGGVDINVPEALTDYSYPVEEGVVGTFSIAAGPQHMDGDTALKYARSRHSTSDFDRSARQQEILGALLEKIKSQNPLENLGLARSVLAVIQKHAEWTFSSRDLIGLAGSVLAVPKENIVSMHLNTSVGGNESSAEVGGFVLNPPPEMADAGAILLPYSLSGKLSDWGQLRTFATILFTHRNLSVFKPTVSIIAVAGQRDAAYRLRNELLRNGFTVSDTIGTTSGSGGVLAPVRGPVPEFLSQYLVSPLTLSGSMEQSSVRISLDKAYRFMPLEKALSL